MYGIKNILNKAKLKLFLFISYINIFLDLTKKKNILFLLDNEYYINIVDINIIVLYIFVKFYNHIYIYININLKNIS